MLDVKIQPIISQEMSDEISEFSTERNLISVNKIK